jgi:hypothetical protein
VFSNPFSSAVLAEPCSKNKLASRSPRLLCPGCSTSFTITLTLKKQHSKTENLSSHELSRLGGLFVDYTGSIYGTARYGGKPGCSAGFGCGVVFKLSQTASGGWHETVIHSFTGGKDGGLPNGYLTVDASGNVYGTTAQGGQLQSCGGVGCGVAFEFSPTPVGWTGTLLHTFTGGTDGGTPVDGFALFGSNLFGVTSAGGNLSGCAGSGCGVVYELAPTAGGWQQTTLYAFSGGVDGSTPSSGVIVDALGNLYGETAAGGNLDKGVVFQVIP